MLALGILGAIVLRAVFIFAGVMLIEQFRWLLAIFGGFLVYTGVKALWEEYFDSHTVLTFDEEQPASLSNIIKDLTSDSSLTLFFFFFTHFLILVFLLLFLYF